MTGAHELRRSRYRLRRFFHRFAGPVDTFGEQALFYGESMRYIPNALTRYRKETIRLSPK